MKKGIKYFSIVIGISFVIPILFSKEFKIEEASKGAGNLAQIQNDENITRSADENSQITRTIRKLKDRGI